MKLKKVTSILLAAVILVTTSAFSANALAEPEAESEPLGTSTACAGNILGEFSGVPACVNENGELHICENNFPDSAFRNYLRDAFGFTENSYITENKADTVTNIYCQTFEYDNDSSIVISFKGIEFFKFLATFECNGFIYENFRSGGKVKELNLDNNKMLTELNCRGNQIQTLSLKNCTNLLTLYCQNNQLSSLDLSNNKNLTEIECSNNNLVSIDLSNQTDLTYFVCNYNNLTELDLSNNTKLLSLGCSNNKLKELDVSNNVELLNLSFTFNEIYNLDLSKNRKIVDTGWFGNHLAQLDLAGLEQMSFEYLGESQDQTIDLKAYPDGNGNWKINLSERITKDGLKNVTVTTDGAEYDSNTGIITVNHFPNEISYSYYNGLVGDFDNFNTMDPKNPLTHLFVKINVTKGEEPSSDPEEPTTEPNEPTTEPTTKPDAEDTTANNGKNSESANENQNNGSNSTGNSDNTSAGKNSVSPRTGAASQAAVAAAVMLITVSAIAAIIITKRKTFSKTN